MHELVGLLGDYSNTFLDIVHIKEERSMIKKGVAHEYNRTIPKADSILYRTFDIHPLNGKEGNFPVDLLQLCLGHCPGNPGCVSCR